MACFKTLRWMLMAGGVSAACMSSLRAAATAPAAEPEFTAEQITFFEKNVRPVLAENCYSCHEGHKAKSGLHLNSRAGVLRGTDYKKVLIPGDPENSVFIKAIRHAAGVEAMPPKKPQLASNEIDALVQWVKMGAPWPKEAGTGGHHASWESHWAFQKVVKPEPPKISNPKLKPSNNVDAFLAAKLDKAGLGFAPAADRATLGRRLYITLTGLPPTYEQLQAFIKDPSPDAPSKLIDTLLDSPHYGERWARYWLDIARYSDTEGYQVAGKDIRYPYAFTYRDWVVQALNSDMAYDEFLRQQIAADRMGGADGNVRNLAAMGFLTVGDTFISNKDLQTDDRIDVLTRGMQGLTVTCARCHDHKFDPIPTKDYYSLYSIINSSEIPDELPVIGKAANEADYAAYKAEISKVEAKMEAFRKEVFDDIRNVERLREYLAFAQQAYKDGLQAEAFRGKAGQLKLRDRVASRWRDFLKRQVETSRPNPVMVAWKEFSAVPAGDFEKSAAAVHQKLAKEGSPANAVIRNELAKRPAPKSMADVLGLYADVFATCISGTQPDNADWQQVRSVLVDGQSPMAVPVDQVEQQFFTRKDMEQMVRFRNEAKRIELSSPGAPPRAMVMVDKAKPFDMRVFIRGNPGRPGEVAPRGYLTLLGGEKFTEGSGRLELARAIGSKDNPLTARVMVNRVWLQHFGRPLVSQTSDFGVQTPAPEQLELLNWLSATFMEEGWSLKKLHRVILNSRAWQQSCESTPDKDLKDPENNLISRMNRQRLDYEAMRDAMLRVTGTLDGARVGGRPVALNAPDVNTRRSLYLVVDRFNQATVPAMFDFANPDTHSPQRFVTTVPQQALFLMNSPFMRDQSGTLAAKLPVQGSTVDSQTITALYRQVLLRDPTPQEVELVQRFNIDATELQATPPFLWRYGAGKARRDAANKITGFEFIPFTTYNATKNRKWWGMSKDMPDKQWSYTHWAEGGGHPGTAYAAMLRWVAPADAVIRITGKLERYSPNGNGVRAFVISDKQGILIDHLLVPKTSRVMEVPTLKVKRGEVIDFVVDAENGDTNSDGFDWRPSIYQMDPAAGTSTLLTKSDQDFNDASLWPPSRPRPQSALSQLVQVLLMSNEFQFVD